MKISKFNENQTNQKVYVVYSNNRDDDDPYEDSTVVYAFKDEKNCNNFILNTINNNILRANDEDVSEYIVDNYSGIAKYDEDNYIFTDVQNAIDFADEYEDINSYTYSIK